jgi:transposase
MPVIVIVCPVSGLTFSTGINIDKASFDVLRDVPAQARCPHCGREHEWSKRDARLVESIPAGEWIENQKRELRVAR